jgi:hypothetical protein
MVSGNGMPHTSHASRNALAAPAIADFHGAKRHTASINARRSGGIDATSAERKMLPATGL